MRGKYKWVDFGVEALETIDTIAKTAKVIYPVAETLKWFGNF